MRNLVLNVQAGVGLDQQLGDARKIQTRCMHESRGAILGLGVDISATLDEKLHHCVVTQFGRGRHSGWRYIHASLHKCVDYDLLFFLDHLQKAGCLAFFFLVWIIFQTRMHAPIKVL